jgi:hypothetical protein
MTKFTTTPVGAMVHDTINQQRATNTGAKCQENYCAFGNCTSGSKVRLSESENINVIVNG